MGTDGWVEAVMPYLLHVPTREPMVVQAVSMYHFGHEECRKKQRESNATTIVVGKW